MSIFANILLTDIFTGGLIILGGKGLVKAFGRRFLGPWRVRDHLSRWNPERTMGRRWLRAGDGVFRRRSSRGCLASNGRSATPCAASGEEAGLMKQAHREAEQGEERKREDPN